VNNKLLFDKWLSLLEAGINYFLSNVYCDFQSLFRKSFCFELQTLITVTYIVMSKAKFVIS